jgi:hypothetical protein
VKAVIRIRPEPAYRREAFVKGLQRIGYTISDGSRDNRDWRPDGREDLLVLWNRKQGTDERMAEVWEARGGTVLVVENAYLQQVDKSMYAISTHQHNGAGWFPVGGEDRFSGLGFPSVPMRSTTPVELSRVLVIGQRGIGSKLMASPALWGEKQLARLGRKHAWVRPHPGNFKPRVPLLADIEKATDVLIWSSSAGVRALVEGLPVHHHAPHWICEDWRGNREAALNRMAHGQWSVEEITAGEPFARMQAENWGPKLWR